MQAGEPDPPASDPAPDAPRPSIRCPLPRWGRRIGALAFLFFLIKGLLWLAVPALIAMGVAF